MTHKTGLQLLKAITVSAFFHYWHGIDFTHPAGSVRLSQKRQSELLQSTYLMGLLKKFLVWRSESKGFITYSSITKSTVTHTHVPFKVDALVCEITLERVQLTLQERNISLGLQKLLFQLLVLLKDECKTKTHYITSYTIFNDLFRFK